MADHDEFEVSALVSTSASDDIAPMVHVNKHGKTLSLSDSTLQNMEYTESELNSSVSRFRPFFGFC